MSPDNPDLTLKKIDESGVFVATLEIAGPCKIIVIKRPNGIVAMQLKVGKITVVEVKPVPHTDNNWRSWEIPPDTIARLQERGIQMLEHIEEEGH